VSTLYDKIEIRKISNGWIVKYYSSGDKEKAFTKFHDLVKFIQERLD